MGFEKTEIVSELGNNSVDRTEAAVEAGAEHRALYGTDDQFGNGRAIDGRRESIARVVDELTLSAARSGDGAAAVKLGGLLAADAILFVEPEPGAEPPRVRLEFVETRTGIRLGDGRELWKVALGVSAGPAATPVPYGENTMLVPLADGTLLELPVPSPSLAQAEEGDVTQGRAVPEEGSKIEN